MKKIIYIIILIIISKTTYSQYNSIGILGSYDLNMNEYNDSVKSPVNGYTLGMAQRNYVGDSEKLVVNAGLTYSNRGHETEYTFITMTPGDPLIPSSTTVKNGIINLYALIGYSILNNEKFKIVPSLGASLGGNIYYKETTKFEDGSESTEKELFIIGEHPKKKSQFAARFQLDFEYYFTNNFFIILQPYYYYDLLNEDYETYKSQQLFGVQLSLNHSLGKSILGSIF